MKVCPHLKMESSWLAFSLNPMMNKAAAKASTVVSLVGLPKLTGFPAIKNGRQRDVPLTRFSRTFSACSQLQSNAANPNFSIRWLSAEENAISEKGLRTTALFGKSLIRGTNRTSPWRLSFSAVHFLGSHCPA